MKEALLGRRIAYVRKERGITSADLAKACDVTGVYMRMIECGRKTPSLQLLVEICNALEVSPDFLLADSLLSLEEESHELDGVVREMPDRTKDAVLTMVQTLLEYSFTND